MRDVWRGAFVCLWLVACGQHRGLASRGGNLSGSSGDAGSSEAPRVLPSPGGDVGDVVGEPASDDASLVFDTSVIRTYELSIAPDDLAQLDAKPNAEMYVPGMLSFEGHTYGPIGVRYKGSSGAFLAPCTAATFPGIPPGPKVGKCSIKLSFDELDSGARFYGLKKLNLHSMGRDPSMLRERLGYALYRQLGVAASRATYARVLINGKLEGLFIAVEQVDSHFTRGRFSEGGKGNLYKEIWPLYDDPALYRTALEDNKGPDTDVDKMLAFKQAIDAGGSAAAAWLDRDYMLRYIAVDRLILNDDGMFHWYCIGPQGSNPGPIANHNYYWYEAQKAGRLWLIPWDLDGSMAAEPRVHIDPEWSADGGDCSCHISMGFPQRAATCDPLSAEFASWRADYETMVDQLLAGPFSEAAVGAQLDAWTEQIAPLVDATAGLNGAPDADTWRAAVATLQAVLSSSRLHRGFDYAVTAP
jgi:hypothetical protein